MDIIVKTAKEIQERIRILNATQAQMKLTAQVQNPAASPEHIAHYYKEVEKLEAGMKELEWLLEENKPSSKGRRVVAVDLDATILEYHKWEGLEVFGEPLPGAKEFLEELSIFADIIIWTTRCSEEMQRGYSMNMLKKMVKEHLDKYNLKYHEIWIGQGKPIAAAFVDDRAVSCRPQENPDCYKEVLEQVKNLCIKKT